ALAIHNFPEGFATFLAGLEDMTIAIPVAVAIAIHNIPEGIAVAVPLRAATMSRSKAFWWATASGFAEPLGALIGFLILMPFIGPAAMGICFAMVAGIMVYISLDELLPSAVETGKHHHAIYGLIAGMAIMAISLLLFTQAASSLRSGVTLSTPAMTPTIIVPTSTPKTIEPEVSASHAKMPSGT